MNTGPDLQPHAAGREFISNRSRVRNGARKAVEFRDNERIPVAYSGEGLVEPRPFPCRAGKAMVGINAISRHTEF
ncbi:hypothetical protein PSE10C_57260 [Pseudomonas amygdali pv. eriobotryae]|uniref:Uncharacterized protein n=2 Tax=Pseudomonas syringae group TaxID=136849 RepID=A0A2K4X4C0_PSESX|nr:hypothetical protein AC519_0593 [Pseudomonas savastanoi]GFZ63403.1 hypothetical protein PSE10A_59140 [Pseudomonas amygdali pv. eriobotryae]GFZ74984.1 hypothetical protein PSE10C_57260 [Pseudomonas amygdali pv. eriobotryae]SOS43112.1 hypothetical protein CFBP3840_P400084 [Pseudomonas syringae]